MEKDIFKKLKKITPDPEYARRSRLLIVGRETERAVHDLKSFVFSLVKSGSALAMTAALLFLLLGSFSIWKIFSPASTALLDPTSLKAEAQAIDIQIQLTNIAYQEPNLSNETSGPALAPSVKSVQVSKEAKKEAENLGLSAATSSQNRISIDQALDSLSQ